jgi:serine/threonine-protein kinase
MKNPPIGQGGMGVVYKAYDIITKRFVAIKTMWGNVDPAAIELFEREWTVLARISHPNIVDILDTGEFRENGRRKPYFVMPLLPGTTLENLIRNASQRLTVERIVEVICQACRGLQAAHDQGLVHRDLKPSNIFVMEDDTVKIIDFGVVHLADTRSATGIKGTLHYMAPEQFDLKPSTALSDIFSLSVVCYEALTGRKPFARKTEMEVVEAIRTYIPPPASEINPAVNQLLSRTVHKGMAKQAWHRFSSAREFGDTLQKALRSEPIERFDRAKIQPRIERIKKACAEGDHQFGLEILTELESEGHIDPEMAVLRIQIEQAVRQKTIRQLLESARTRMEEDEYPLALQKIQDVLNVDATNIDALNLKKQIERQRGEKQIENWMRLVREHLDNQLYSQARQGLQEILKINNSHTKARELLVEVDRTEQEAVKLREEQQKLYDAALTAYKNGEISTALSKLERVLELSRRSPKSAPSDRDAQYQSLYNQIRSERDAARNAYAEARNQLDDHKFARVLEICEEFLGKHPGDPLFQALKIEAEEAQRQEQSAAVAEVNRRIDAEPDLDKKYNIVKQALEKYPNEPHFNSSLKLIRDRRDLVNSIVGRARQYEERSQFNDAAGQWDILRNIYPLYPGLDFEVERLGRRREEQIQNERKARWVEQVDRYFAAGKYAKARETCEEALQQFPDDPELKGLHGLAGQGIKRNAEASVLLHEGQELCSQQRYDEGLDALRKAEHLDPPNTAIHAALLGALVQRARDLMGKDWHLSEPLIKEAGEIDSGDPVVRALSSLIEDHKRQDAINGILLDARNLQGGGELQAALKRVETGLELYPNEIRLSQLHNTLRAATTDSRRGDSATQAVMPPTQTAPAPVESFAQEPVPSATEPAVRPSLAAGPARHAARSKTRIPLWWTAIAAGILVIAAALLFNRLRAPSNPAPATPVATTPTSVTAPVPPSSPDWVALPLDLPINTALLSPSPERIRLILESNATEGTVFVNGMALTKPMTNGSRVVTLPPGTYKLKVAQEGYEDSPEQTVEIKPSDANPKPLTFTLVPIQRPATLVVQSAPPGANVLIDGQPAGVVDANGSFSREVSAGSHSIGLRKQGFEDLSVSREFKAGEKTGFAGDAMKAYGTLAFRISPATASVTYRRDGDATASSADNGQTLSLKSGSYVITAKADTFKSRSDTVQVLPGKTVSVDWNLEPAAAVAEPKLSPARVFENANSWTTDKSGWWVHNAKGYSFLRANQGTFIFDILKEEQKGLFRSRTKRVVFVADYRDEQNRIVYTLDGRTLTRKLVASERSVADVKAPLGSEANSVYRVVVEIMPGSVIVRDGNGKVLDSIRRLGPPGKFGFQDEVALSVASAP